MTTQQKIKLLKSMTDEADEDILLAYLDIAREAILKRLYPFDDTKTEVPARYVMTEIDAAVCLLSKRGAESQTQHSENGIVRTYESAGLPESILKTITPYAKVLGGGDEVS